MTSKAMEKKDYEQSLAPASDKPLNSTQVKNMREIVNGDFDSLKGKMHADIDRQARARKAEVEERYKAPQRGWEQWQARFEKLADDAQARFEKLTEDTATRIATLMAQAAEKGLVPASPPAVMNVATNAKFVTARTRTEANRVATEQNWYQSGKDTEIRKINDTASQLKNVVNTILARQTQQIERSILVQSLPGGPAAMDIINDLPDAEDVMSLVRAELATNDNDLLLAMVGEVADS